MTYRQIFQEQETPSVTKTKRNKRQMYLYIYIFIFIQVFIDKKSLKELLLNLMLEIVYDKIVLGYNYQQQYDQKMNDHEVH
jgi:uncharacterized membrane protein